MDDVEKVDVLDSQILTENVSFRSDSCPNLYRFKNPIASVQEYLLEQSNKKERNNTSCKVTHNSQNTSFSKIALDKSSISQVGIRNKIVDKKLKAWGLPQEIVSKYEEKGVIEMFDWQVKCLANSKVLFESCNLVYSAPTSAGKTLVAEILSIKTILERQKKVIMILPFVSIVREKMFYLQDILSSSGIRVEGFMGSHSPPGGLQAVHVAICTIEKANSLINRLLDDGQIHELGAIIVDELHLLGDPHRGYILELLLTKIKYVSSKFDDVQVQVIGMSATLPNLEILASWLNAELFVTEYRPIPLDEYCLVENKLFNKQGLIEKILPYPTSASGVLGICLDTIKEGCSVLIFCMTKNRCESLAQSLAGSFYQIGCQQSDNSTFLRNQLNPEKITEVLEQLNNCPVGLDQVLKKTISFGVAYHHAGLTFDERDIIEGAFKSGAIRVLVATSTLSSGVNLPARKVIVRSPVFFKKPINTLSYKQMIGRAGRMGKDTKGESILMCEKGEKDIGFALMMGTLDPVNSCIGSEEKYMRAVLEIIASQVTCTVEELKEYSKCTLLHSQNSDSYYSLLYEVLKKLLVSELVRLQQDVGTMNYVATPLGKACLSASMAPGDGLSLFLELQKARQCLVLENDLHLIYLVTPYSVSDQWGDIDWLHFSSLWESSTKATKKIGELVGVTESYIMNFVRHNINTHRTVIYRRFYTALALQDLVNEVPLSEVAAKFQRPRGFLQSLQQAAATFAGMVTAFCHQLGWKNLEILISQFQDRLHFGVNSELLDLMKLLSLNGVRARALFDSGFETVSSIASADVNVIENVLYKAVPFQSEKQRDDDDTDDVRKRNKLKSVWITGCCGMTVKEAAQNLIAEARKLVEAQIGVTEIKWDNKTESAVHNPDDISNNDAIVDPLQITKEEILDDKPVRNTVHSESIYTTSIMYTTLISEGVFNKTSENMKEEKIIKSETEIQQPITLDDPVHSNRLSENFLDDSCDDINQNKTSKGVDTFINHNTNIKQSTPVSVESHLVMNSAANMKDEIKEEISKSETEIQQSITSDDPVHSNRLSENFLDDSCDDINQNKTSKGVDTFINHNTNIKQSTPVSVESPLVMDSAANIKDEIIWDSLEFTETAIQYITKCPNDNKNYSPITNFEDTDNSLTENDIGTSKSLNQQSASVKDVSLFSTDGDNSSLFEESLPLHLIPSKILDNGKSPVAVALVKKETASDFTSINSETMLKAFKSPIIFNENLQTDCPSQSILLNENEVVCSQETMSIHSFKSPHKRTLKEKSHEVTNFKKQKLSSCVKTSSGNIVAESYQENPNIKIIKFNNYTIRCEFLNEISVYNHFKLNNIKTAAVSIVLNDNITNKVKIGRNIQDETPNLDIKDGSVKGVALYVGDNSCYYLDMMTLFDEIELLKKRRKSWFLEEVALRACSLSSVYIPFKEWLGADSIPSCYDIALVERLMFGREKNSQGPNIFCMLQKYFGFDISFIPMKINNTIKMYKQFDHKLNACFKAWCIWQIAEKQQLLPEYKLLLQNNVLNTEHQTALILAACEEYGIEVDRNYAKEIWSKANKSIDILQKKARKLAGYSININSSKSVAIALNLWHRGKPKRTNKTVLSCHSSPLASIVMYWRKLKYALTQTLYPLIEESTNYSEDDRVNTTISTGKIYPKYTMDTLTGRVSMHEPNLQNVPRTFTVPSNCLDSPNDVEFNIRHAFRARAGYVMVSADYCQLEMRVLTHFSEDKVLMDIMKSDADVFKRIAASWSDVPEDKVDDDLRQKAKQLCYGILYGMGNSTLARNLDVTELDAAHFIHQFYLKFTDVNEYKDLVSERFQMNGYVETLMKRRRYINNVGSQLIKKSAERQALNTTIQGSAADIAKAAMCAIDNKVGTMDPKPRLLLQMHDELIYEVHESKKNEFIKIMKEAMEGTIKLKVPLPVRVKSGYSWGTLRDDNY